MSGQSGIFNAITAIDTKPYVEVFTKRVKDGKEYVYLKTATTSGAITDGSLVYFLPGTDTVTDDVANSKANLVAGVNDTGSTIAAGAATTSYYFWALTKGRGVTLNTNGDDDIAKGDTLIAGTTGTVNSIAAGTDINYKPVGWAEADDSNTYNTVLASVDIG